MSLVRVKKIDGNLIIVSDTKLTYKHDKQESLIENNPTLGTIKIILINDKICICFAGGIKYARKAIRKIIVEDIVEIDRLKETLHDSSIESYISGEEDEVDFILCHSQEGNPSIFEIKEMEMKEVNQSWIGDKRGFNKYQATYLSEDDEYSRIHDDNELRLIKIPDEFSKEQSKIYSKMFDAMYSVIVDDHVSSVGGFVIPVTYSDGTFKYGTYLSNIRKPLAYHEIENNLTIPFGDASIGSCLINLSSGQYKYISIYMLQCKLGIVYKLDENYSMSPTLYKDTDEIDFNKIIEQEYEITINLTVETTKEHYYIKGLHLIEEDSYDAGYYMLKALRTLISGLERKHGVELKRISDIEALKLTTYETNFLTLCFYYMAVISYYIQKREKAISYLNKAIKLSPNFEEAKQFLVKVMEES